MEWATLGRYFSTGDFDAVIHPVVASDHPAALLGGGRIGAAIGYSNSRADELIAEARETMNPERMAEIYYEITTILQEDLPVTSLYPQVWTTVAHRRVRGLSSPYRTDPITHMDDVWIEEENR